MKSLTLLLTLIASSAFAGTSDRGGGNALVCFDSPAIPKAIRLKGNPSFGKITDAALRRITKIEMLDLYQAKLPSRGSEAGRRRNVLKAKPGETPDSLALRALDRIENYAPSVFDKINAGYQALRMNTSYAPHGVAPIDDTKLLFQFDRNMCVIATMAAQDAANDELFVDSRLYRHAKHSVESRAATLLHEWTYHPLLHSGVDNSAGVRSVLSRLLVDEPARVSLLLEAAAKAGLISTPREKLNGLQQLVMDHYKALAEDISWRANSGWLTLDCHSNGDECKSFWSERQFRIAEMKELNVYCAQMDECVRLLEDLVNKGGDAEALRKAKSSLGWVKRYVARLAIGKELRTWVNTKFDLSAPGHASANYSLPEGYTTEASEKFRWALEQSADFSDRMILLVTHANGSDEIADYQSSTRVALKSVLDRVEGFRQSDIIRFEILELPYLQ